MVNMCDDEADNYDDDDDGGFQLNAFEMNSSSLHSYSSSVEILIDLP